MYTYRIKVTRVVDGDTIDADIDLGFDVWVHQRFRLSDIDAPEIRTRDLVEKEAGKKTTKWLEEQIANAKEILVHTSKTGKYGRYLATLIIDGRVINEEMLAKGLAKPYGAR